MSIIDIRTGVAVAPTTIIFSNNGSYDTPDRVMKDGSELVFGSEDDEYIYGIDLKDVPNLIKALQKAVELGWVPAPVVAKPKLPAKAVAKKPATKK